MKCKICHHASEHVFNALLLRKYRVSYYGCPKCGFLQTEEPYWLEEAYEASINISDTGLMARNLFLSQITTLMLFFLFRHDANYIDYAGGYGIYTRLMRDIGFDFCWHDKYSPNLVARGFECAENGKAELVTCFEAFEHFSQPLLEIEAMLQRSKNILFSTELLPPEIPEPDAWAYYGLGHGQHIGFYSRRTLEFIASKYNLHFYSNGASLHLFTEKKLSPMAFKMVLRLRRFGAFHIIKRFLTSKTNDDWERLR